MQFKKIPKLLKPLRQQSCLTLREIELKSISYFAHSTKSPNERNERTFPAKFVLGRSSVLPPADAAVRRRISERHVRVETGGDEFLGAKQKNWPLQIWFALSSKSCYDSATVSGRRTWRDVDPTIFHSACPLPHPLSALATICLLCCFDCLHEITLIWIFRC